MGGKACLSLSLCNFIKLCLISKCNYSTQPLVSLEGIFIYPMARTCSMSIFYIHLSLSPSPPPFSLLCNYNQALSPVSPLQCLDPCWHCSLSSPGEGFGSPGEGSESPAEPHPRPLGGWGSLTSLPVSHTHQTSLQVTLYCSLSLYLMSCLEMEIQPKSTLYTKLYLDKAVIKFKSAPQTWCNAFYLDFTSISGFIMFMVTTTRFHWHCACINLRDHTACIQEWMN